MRDRIDFILQFSPAICRLKKTFNQSYLIIAQKAEKYYPSFRKKIKNILIFWDKNIIF